MQKGLTLFVVVAVGVLGALAVADALRSGRSSSTPGTALTATTSLPVTTPASPPSTSTVEAAPAAKACGGFRIAPPGEYPLLVVEVVVGDVSCQQARRVMKAQYIYIAGDRRSWLCHGPEGDAGCQKPSGETVSARFADELDDPEWEIDRIANRWAQVFAVDERSCFHMTQPLCERIACERVGGFKIPNCTPPTSAFRKSFEKATVQDIAIITGDYVAAAKLSNGVVVELLGDGGTWSIRKLGGNTGRNHLE
jgi:hypothetical protein